MAECAVANPLFDLNIRATNSGKLVDYATAASRKP
jgi:hypothetical protein